MQVILLADIDKLGYKHQVVDVKPGYGRNYLIPQGLALVANKSNMGRLAELERQADRKEAAKLDHYKELASKLQEVTLRIGAKAGENGKIFGSVTDLQLSQALMEQAGAEVERRKIEMPEEVKHIGDYTAHIKLHKEVEVDVKFSVVGE
jgi:large subunit ribosomal protein L9